MWIMERPGPSKNLTPILPNDTVNLSTQYIRS